MPTVCCGRARLFLAKFAILSGLKWQKMPLTLEMANFAIVVGIFCVEEDLLKYDGFFDRVFMPEIGVGIMNMISRDLAVMKKAAYSRLS